LVDPQLIVQFQNEIESCLDGSHFQDPRHMRCRFAVAKESGAQILDAIDPITDVSEFARKIALSDKILDLLSLLYDDRPCLFKDKFILRNPGAPGYPPHQDFIAWPFYPHSFLTVLVAIDKISPANGCLAFYRGSH